DAAACNRILGYDPATLDPNLDASSSIADPCPVYCDEITRNCSGDRLQYTTPSVCLTTCYLLEPGGPEDELTGSTADSAFCRLAHAKTAKVDRTIECPQA